MKTASDCHVLIWDGAWTQGIIGSLVFAMGRALQVSMELPLACPEILL